MATSQNDFPTPPSPPLLAVSEEPPVLAASADSSPSDEVCLQSEQSGFPYNDEAATLWGALTAAGRANVIEHWSSREWLDLSQFCRVRGLSYRSVYDAFRARGVPTVVVGQLHIGDAAKLHMIASAQVALDAVVSVSDTIRAIQQQILHKLAIGEWTLHQLIQMGSEIAGQARGASDALTAISGVLKDFGHVPNEATQEVRVDARATLVSPEVQASVDAALRNTAESIVRSHQLHLHNSAS